MISAHARINTPHVPSDTVLPSEPRVSVVVPVYNGAQHLVATLDALCRQTCSALDIIVIDDGSTDESAAVVRAYPDRRVRLIQQGNRGLAHALNHGIAEARAPYLARNDQDDLSVPHRLERQLSVLDSRPDAIAVFAHWTKFGDRRTWDNADHHDSAGGEVRGSMPERDGCLLASTLCARTDVLRRIGGFRQEYYPSDDWDLQLRLSGAGTVLVIGEALVAYRFHTGANTYRLFLLDQDKARWAEDSYARRASGTDELPFDDFVERCRRHQLKRMTTRLADRSKLQMRLAGQRYLDGHDVAALGHAALATCLNPIALGRRVAALLLCSFLF